MLTCEADQPFGTASRVRLWRTDGLNVPTAPAAAHPRVEIAWLDEGTCEYAIGRARITAGGDAAMIVPRHVEHATAFRTVMHGVSVHLDVDVVAEIADAMGTTLSPDPCLSRGAARVGVLGRMLAEELRADLPGARITQDALVEALVVAALRGVGSPRDARAHAGPVDPAIALARSRIHACFAEPLDVATLASEARMSRFHFSRRFREQVGRSPYDYLLDVRVERAAEMLRSGRHSVTEAAFASGFGDLGRFSKRFRSRFGVAPSAYAHSRATFA